MKESTLDQCLQAARREFAMREGVYPRAIARGAMTREESEHQLACMRQIIRILERMGNVPNVDLARAPTEQPRLL